MALIEQVAESLASSIGRQDRTEFLPRAAQVTMAFEREHGRPATGWSEIEEWLSQSFRGTRASVGEMIGLSEDEIATRLSLAHDAELKKAREDADMWKAIFWIAVVLVVIGWLASGRGPAPWEYPL